MRGFVEGEISEYFKKTLVYYAENILNLQHEKSNGI